MQFQQRGNLPHEALGSSCRKFVTLPKKTYLLIPLIVRWFFARLMLSVPIKCQLTATWIEGDYGPYYAAASKKKKIFQKNLY